MAERDQLRIAVPRGALFAETLDLLDRIGFETREVRENDRKLLFERVGIVTMRPSNANPRFEYSYAIPGARVNGTPSRSRRVKSASDIGV